MSDILMKQRGWLRVPTTLENYEYNETPRQSTVMTPEPAYAQHAPLYATGRAGAPL